MGNCSIQSQFGPDSDTHDHETDLIDFAVAKNASQVIFDDCVKNGKHRHHRTNQNKNIGSWKKAGKHADRAFGGKGAKPDRSRRSGLRIGILEPNVQPRECGLDSDCNQNQERPDVTFFKRNRERDQCKRLFAVCMISEKDSG